eukprot:5480925-Alexandrium_andersonii.AAC.1
MPAVLGSSRANGTRQSLPIAGCPARVRTHSPSRSTCVRPRSSHSRSPSHLSLKRAKATAGASLCSLATARRSRA